MEVRANKKEKDKEKLVECFGSLCNRLGLFFNCLPFGVLPTRRWLVECVGLFFMGVCRLLGRSCLLLVVVAPFRLAVVPSPLVVFPCPCPLFVVV